MSSVTIQTTKIYSEFTTFHDSPLRIGVWQGGTRSSKTYNIVLGWVLKLAKEDNQVLTVCRETMVSLKNTVYRDFMEILHKTGLYDEKNLSKGEMTYMLGTNLIEFRGLDDDQKVRGAKRDYLYINEANEIPFPIFKQLLFRTKKKIVLDYNPSEEFHWIYSDVLTRSDCAFHKSTYLDNPFLPDDQVNEIERLKDLDPNYWRVYGLGERGMSEATIFKNWELCDTIPESNEVYYGLDFGFNDPNALIQVTFYEGDIYLKELLYKSQLTSSDLILELKDKGLDDTATIYGDNSRPETIQEIYVGGFNIHSCTKGKGSIKAGIDWIKKNKVFVTKDSLNLIKELKSYKWKIDKNERVLDEPVDVNNHLIDALRYGLNEKIHNVSSEISTVDDIDFLF